MANGIWEAKEAQHLRPTLLIGLGGSGKDVLLRVRRLFYERLGKNPDGTVGYPVIGYLVLDTDPGSPKLLEGDGPSDFVLHNIQFQRGGAIREFIDCSLGNQQLEEYSRGGRTQFPHVFSWLQPEATTRFGASISAHGAGQNRQIGRLAFFHHFEGTSDRKGIRPTLEHRLKQILSAATTTEANKWKGAGMEVAANELDVILVYSLAGGTGAGMFLDMAMLVRDVIANLGLREDLKPYLTHFAILPEPFLEPTSPLSPEEKGKIQESAYAALREMEYFSMRLEQAFDLTIPPPVPAGDAAPQEPTWYQVQWQRGGPIVKVRSAPWDTCFLVGGSNDLRGPACLSPAEVYQMVAEYIFLDFDPNQFGTRKRMRRPNVAGRVMDQAKDDVLDESGTLYSRFVSRRFSIMGLSQIYFDRARMRRAASYRLAVSLLDHWMRKLALAPTLRRTYARDDVLLGNPLPGVNAPGVPLSFEALGPGPRQRGVEAPGGLMLVKDRKTDRKRTWLHDVDDDGDKLRHDIDAPGFDPLTEASVLEAMLARHLEGMARNPTGGKEGLARESMTANRRALAEEVEVRLRALFLYRLAELGVPETLELLDEYAGLIQNELKVADGWTRYNVQMEPVWKRRLDEARRLPNWPLLRPAQRAAREELLRAVREGEKFLKNSYIFEASEYIRDTLADAQQRIAGGAGSAATRSSYRDILLRFQELQGRARGYLEDRFAELCKADTGQNRTVGLLANWSAEAYDSEIRTFLTARKPASGGTYHQLVEKDVLDRFRELKSREEVGKWDDATSLGGLVLVLLRAPERSSGLSARTSGVSAGVVEDFAKVLANACWELLEDFCKDHSALELFNEDHDSQQRHFDVLREFSAPFLRRNNTARYANEGDTPSLIQLGIHGHGEPAALKFQKDLQVRDQGAHNLASLQAFGTQDDAIVLCQEKHGIPLYYYQFLEAMGRLYYGSNYQPERHFDFEFLKDRLPEIRKIDPDKQAHLANSMELTLQGIMTGVLRYDDGQFWLLRSGGMYAEPIPYPQGSRLENMVHRYAENETDRQELARRVGEWLSNAAVKGDGHRLVLLWCATEDLLAEVSRRVAHLVGKLPAGGTAGQPQHPLYKILAQRMLPELRKRVQGLSAGSRWIGSRIDRHAIRNDPERAPEEVAEALEERRRLLEPCFRELPNGLPIRVVRHDAVLRLEDVAWDRESAVAVSRVVVVHRPEGLGAEAGPRRPLPPRESHPRHGELEGGTDHPTNGG
jgi:hypothetical protein